MSQTPSRREIAAAVDFFTRTNPLCAAQGFATARGFAVTVSFNASIFQYRNNMIELALKAARLEFVVNGTACDWSDEIGEFARTHALPSTTDQEQIPPPTSAYSLLYGLERPGSESSLTSGQDISPNKKHRSAAISSEVEMMFRGAGRFEMRFHPIPRRDLVRFNPELHNVSVLNVTDGASLSPPDVSLRLNLDSAYSETEVVHCLSIRAALGTWESLVDDRNRQIVGEILLSKFIKPIHRAVMLWPLETSNDA